VAEKSLPLPASIGYPQSGPGHQGQQRNPAEAIHRVHRQDRGDVLPSHFVSAAESILDLSVDRDGDLLSRGSSLGWTELLVGSAPNRLTEASSLDVNVRSSRFEFFELLFVLIPTARGRRARSAKRPRAT